MAQSIPAQIEGFPLRPRNVVTFIEVVGKIINSQDFFCAAL
jgi:hypothetical protein